MSVREYDDDDDDDDRTMKWFVTYKYIFVSLRKMWCYAFIQIYLELHLSVFYLICKVGINNFTGSCN